MFDGYWPCSTQYKIMQLSTVQGRTSNQTYLLSFNLSGYLALLLCLTKWTDESCEQKLSHFKS